MSNRPPLSALILLIDEWVNDLASWELGRAWQDSADDFFKFMARRGVDPDWCAQLIHEATGLSVEEIAYSVDSGFLRSALRASEYTQAEISYDEDAGIVEDVTDNAKSTAENQWWNIFNW